MKGVCSTRVFAIVFTICFGALWIFPLGRDRRTQWLFREMSSNVLKTLLSLLSQPEIFRVIRLLTVRPTCCRLLPFRILFPLVILLAMSGGKSILAGATFQSAPTCTAAEVSGFILMCEKSMLRADIGHSAFLCHIRATFHRVYMPAKHEMNVELISGHPERASTIALSRPFSLLSVALSQCQNFKLKLNVISLRQGCNYRGVFRCYNFFMISK